MSFTKLIDTILTDAYSVSDLLDENQDEIIQKIGQIIDVCEKFLDSQKMDGFDV